MKTWTRPTKVVLSMAMIALVALYLRPIPTASFDDLYRHVDAETSGALRAFRGVASEESVLVGGVEWRYLTSGNGPEGLVLLHGMGGAGDIWWQQVNALDDRYRILAPTYPAVSSLQELASGVIGIMDREGIARAAIVGTSLGGYLAQYLMAQWPERITRVVLGNTFPPTDFYAEDRRVEGALLPVLPGWALMRFFRSTIESQLYPASGRSELVRAYLLEQSHGGMTKAQFVGRFRCVVSRFRQPDPNATGIPVLIVESDNDPSVPEHLRARLREAYPGSEVVTLEGAGHFPYLNRPDRYSAVLESFLSP